MDHSEVCARVNNVTMTLFKISVGLRQGCSLPPIMFLIYNDRIVKKSESCGGEKIGDCSVQRRLFPNDSALLHFTQNGLQQNLDKFSYACSVAGMKIRQLKHCSLEIGGVLLQQSEKHKYLGVLFTNDGKQNSALDIHIGKSSAVIRQLHRSIVLKQEYCSKAKLPMF